jgi:branched-chain amino acid transport system substrate-binding protein
MILRLAILLTAISTLPAFADTTIKVGNILALSGDGATVGQHLLQAENLYIKTHADALPPGVHIDLITRDDASKPDNTKRLAQELIVRDHVQMISGIAMSPQGFAIAPVVTEAKVPAILMNATTSSITRASPYLVRFSHSNWQMSYEIGIWAAKHGIKTVYSMVADYAAGIDVENAFIRGFTDNGGKMVGSDHTPLSTTDYLPYMQRVKAAKPDALFYFEVTGPATIATAKAFADADLRGAGIQMIGSGDMVPDDQLPQTGATAAGMVNTSLYTQVLKNPANEAFLKLWRAEFGPEAVPDFTAIAGWNGMEAIYGAVRKLGAGATGDAAMDYFKHYSDANTPQGPISIDPETRDIILDVYLCKVTKVGDHWENVPFDTMKDVKDPWKMLNPL